MKLKLFIFFLFIFYSYSKPVDCTNTPQTVLQVKEKIDCSDKQVCYTFCTDFIPNCPFEYILTNETDGQNNGRSFNHPLYFILEEFINSDLTKEAYQVACIERRYTMIGNNVIRELQDSGDDYLKLLKFNQNENVEKAIKIFTWALKFFKSGNGNVAIRTIEGKLTALTEIIEEFTNEEKEVYALVRESIFQQWKIRAKLYEHLSNSQSPITVLFKRHLPKIGSSVKTSYFGSSIYDIIDRWMENIKLYKKECLLKKKIQKLSEFDENRMKSEKGYPFGPNSSFIYSRDRNSLELKELFRLRNAWFALITPTRSFCKCIDFKNFFIEKKEILENENQDTSKFIQESSKYIQMMENKCKLECQRRERELLKINEQNKEAKRRYDQKMFEFQKKLDPDLPITQN